VRISAGICDGSRARLFNVAVKSIPPSGFRPDVASGGKARVAGSQIARNVPHGRFPLAA